MTDHAIETKGLAKQFGDGEAVHPLDWTVPLGSIVGLLGPNGAGKTTTLKMLVGLTHPTSGTVAVCGRSLDTDVVGIRRATAFVPEDKELYDNMRVRALVRFYLSFFPEANGERVCEQLQQWGVPLNKRIRELSKGMRAKTITALALARNPELLLLDEPAEGLDPEATQEMLALVTNWVSEAGHTAVLATHRLDEVERVCDRIAIMNKGYLVLEGDLDDLRGSWKTIRVIGSIPLAEVASWSDVHHVAENGGTVEVITRRHPEAVLSRLREFDTAVLEVFDMNLHELYLTTVKHSSEALYARVEDSV